MFIVSELLSKNLVIGFVGKVVLSAIYFLIFAHKTIFPTHPFTHSLSRNIKCDACFVGK
jgi:hypothetical protein